MANHKSSPISWSRFGDAVMGGIGGGAVGAVESFYLIWKYTFNYLENISKQLGYLGVLLGWIPGLVAGVAGLVYGAWKGGKIGGKPGIQTVKNSLFNYMQKVKPAHISSSKTAKQKAGASEWKMMSHVSTALRKIIPPYVANGVNKRRQVQRKTHHSAR